MPLFASGEECDPVGEAPGGNQDWCGAPDKSDTVRDPLGQGSVLGVPDGDDEQSVVRTADNPRARPRQARPRSNAFDWIDRNQIAYDAEDAAPFLTPARKSWPSGRDEAATADASDLIAAASQAQSVGAAASLQLGGVTASRGSTLHAGLALADSRVLHMVNAMAGFDAQPASDLARTGRQRDPRVAAMLTSLPDLR